MNLEETTLQQADIVLSGAIDELSTVRNYLSALQNLLRQPLANSEELKAQYAEIIADELKAQYAEIIADELNHLVRFTGLAVDMLGIEVKGD